MSIDAWIAFVLDYGLITVTPGPSTLLVVCCGLSHGRRTALAVVAGTGLGGATCLTAALFGICALLAASASAFSILKVAGAPSSTLTPPPV